MNNGNSNNNNRNNSNRVRAVSFANEPKTYDIPFDSIVEAFFDCIWARSGIDILANSCKFFTYTMWKYIIIAAVVLFLGACFLFFKNNTIYRII